VLKNLRFRLSLDDPTLPKEEWILLQGDRVQLEALCDAVTGYVQQFLEQSHDLLRTTFSVPTDAVIPWSRYAGTVSVANPAVNLATIPHAPDTTGIRMQPRGLLAHDLMLGSLTTEASGEVVHLTTLQLFDLANALEDYTSDAIALPNLERSGWMKGSPAWAQVAAVALVVVGLSTSVLRLVDNSLTASNPTAAPATSQGASSSDQRVATQLPPSVTEKAVPPVSSDQKLPPPPTASTPAKPGLQTVMVPQAAPVNPAPQSVPVAPPAPAPMIVPAPPRAAGEGRSQPPEPSLPPARFESEFSKAPAADQSIAARESQSLARGAAAGTRADANSTAFDTLPQVAEARRYFQERWTPPEGLTQTLEYSLVVNPDGTIQRIVPLGQAAGDYIDRSGIPLVGEAFVSPISTGRSIKIRLVLSPDGNAQTFLE
jgi:hypothetical protein